MADKDFRAIIKAQLNTSEIPNQIKRDIEDRTVTLNNISFNRANLINQIQSALNSHTFNINIGNFNNNGLNSQARQIGISFSRQITQQINSNLSHINVNNTFTQLLNMQKVLKSMNFNNKSIAQITQDLLHMDIAIENIRTHLNTDGGVNISVKGVDKLQNIVNLTRQLNADGSMQNFGTTITQNFAQIEQQTRRNEAAISKYLSKLDTLRTKSTDQNATKPIRDETHLTTLESEFERVRSVIQSLNGASSQTFVAMKANVESEINSLGNLITSYQNAEYAASQLRAKPVETVKAEQLELLRAFIADIQKAGISLDQFTTVDVNGLHGMLQGVFNADGLKQYLNTLSVAKGEFKALKQEAAQYASAADVNILKGKMETWLNKNTKAAGTYGNTVRNLISELNGLASQGKVTKIEVKRISDAFKEVDAAASAAGMKGRSFFQSILGAAKSLTRYFGVSTFIYRTFAAVKEGITNIVDLDTALVDLRKTTDGTVEQLNNFYYSANETAKNLGVTTKEVIQATAEWSRLGYSLKDAEIMAEVSAKFKAISPGVDMEKAQDGLVSAMKAFNIEADEALDGIASKINAIGNSQAVSNADVIEFLTRSSSAMKEANNTLEETIALGTAATEITRDAASVGNALKTVSMRIRGYDEETEEYVGNLEELSGDIADLTKSTEHPLGVSLFTDSSKTEYKSTAQLLRDISQIYDELSDKQQAGLLEKLAGWLSLPEYIVICIKNISNCR